MRRTFTGLEALLKMSIDDGLYMTVKDGPPYVYRICDSKLQFLMYSDDNGQYWADRGEFDVNKTYMKALNMMDEVVILKHPNSSKALK